MACPNIHSWNEFDFDLIFQIPSDQDDELDDEYSQDGERGDGGGDSPGVGTTGGDSSSKGQISGQSPGTISRISLKNL